LSEISSAPVLAFGAHPDDIEFGCGGVLALEALKGRSVHCVICSLGEAASNGTPEGRRAESVVATEALGATVEFVDLDGDAKLEIRSAHALRLAEIIRRVKPSTVLATSCFENQHPDHWRLGKIVRDAARIARYGGLKEISGESHAVGQLFYYAVTPEGEPNDIQPFLIDVSSPDVVNAWMSAMNAHVSQGATRNYIDLQLNRARVWGARAGVEYAMALFPNDPMMFESLAHAGKGARNF